MRAPPRVEGNETADAHVADLLVGELRFDRAGARPLFDLPEKLGHSEQLVAVDAFGDVNAVDAQIGQLLDHLGVRLFVAAERHAIEKNLTMDDVDSDQRSGTQVLPHRLVQLFHLLRDHRVARWVRAGQPAQAGKPLQDGQRVERGRWSGSGRHRLSSSRAFFATRTIGGFQKRNRSDTKPASAGPRLSIPA